MKKLNQLLIVGCALLLLVGCSERENETPVTETSISVHGIGFADASSSNFHAKYIKSKNYDLQLCKSCHGGDFTGGTTGQSCNTCHNKPNGPENCTTCHGSVNAAPPKDLSDNVSPASRGVGAHQKHLLGGIIGKAVACTECHSVPATVTAAGHFDATPNAEVAFDTTSVFHKANASYTSATVSCANTYCHGNFTGGNNLTVAWNNNSGTAAECGTCHGDKSKSTVKEKAFPVSGHTFAPITADCSTCHGSVVNASMTIIDPTRHVNGQNN